MYDRICNFPPNKSFFLFGPRGTGKTSWVRSTFPNAVYIDLLESELYNRMLANPQRLKEYIPSHHKDWVIIDEVQKIPDLLDEVHRLIEMEKLKFILTGSSARKLKKKQAFQGGQLDLQEPIKCANKGQVQKFPIHPSAC